MSAPADDGSNKLHKITDPPPDEPLNKRLAAAHHEAGHVVVGLHFGFSLKWVRLAPKPPVCFWSPCPSDVDHTIIMIAAGPIAGYIFDPDSGEAAAYDGRDKQMIEERRSKQSPDVLRAQAAQLVGKNWDLIVRVANALFKAGELSGDQVRALAAYRDRCS